MFELPSHQPTSSPKSGRGGWQENAALENKLDQQGERAVHSSDKALVALQENAL